MSVSWAPAIPSNDFTFFSAPEDKCQGSCYSRRKSIPPTFLMFLHSYHPTFLTWLCVTSAELTSNLTNISNFYIHYGKY